MFYRAAIIPIINLLILISAVSAGGRTHNLKPGIYFNYYYTYISIDEGSQTGKIFEYHPFTLVFCDTVYRGQFKLSHIRGDFYSIESRLPGQDCIDNMITTCKKDTSIQSNINIVKFNLGEISGTYLIMAKRLSDGKIFQKIYDDSFYMALENDNQGYEFAILPQFNLTNFPFNLNGYNETIKFLKIPPFDSGYFDGNNYLEINLPLFSDQIFFDWCLDGVIVEIKHNQILFNGDKYKLQKNFNYYKLYNL